MVTIFFRGSRAEARRIAYDLKAALTGRGPDTLGLARGVHLAMGMAALSDIKADFVRKSDGQVGEDGVKWPPLSKKYLAYQRRFGTGEQAALKKQAGLGRVHRFGVGGQKGLLTKAQAKRWNQIFVQMTQRFLLSLPPGAAKARAAQIAWARLKAEGAKTLLEVYGNRKVQINRSTDVLLNSLSPGEITGSGAGATYSKPSKDGGEQQIFETMANGVIVGTNVAYAAAVNKQRPFLPKRTPAVWRERWKAATRLAIAVALRMAYERGPQ